MKSVTFCNSKRSKRGFFTYPMPLEDHQGTSYRPFEDRYPIPDIR